MLSSLVQLVNFTQLSFSSIKCTIILYTYQGVYDSVPPGNDVYCDTKISNIGSHTVWGNTTCGNIPLSNYSRLLMWENTVELLSCSLCLSWPDSQQKPLQVRQLLEGTTSWEMSHHTNIILVPTSFHPHLNTLTANAQIWKFTFFSHNIFP